MNFELLLKNPAVKKQVFKFAKTKLLNPLLKVLENKTINNENSFLSLLVFYDDKNKRLLCSLVQLNRTTLSNEKIFFSFDLEQLIDNSETIITEFERVLKTI